MRRAARTDHTQQAIVDALRARGCKVLSLAAMAHGCADLLVSVIPDVWISGYTGMRILYLLEVKNPAGRGTKLTPDQVRFHSDWEVSVVTTPEEALRAVGL